MSETPGPGARRALPPRDDAGTGTADDSGARPRRLAPTAAAADVSIPGDGTPAPRRAAGPLPDPTTAAPDADGTTTEAPMPDTGRDRRASQRGLVLAAGAVAVIALAVVAILWSATSGFTPGPLTTPTPTLDRATLLAGAGDLAGLREGTVWTTTATVDKPDADTPQPRCLLPAPETQPRAARSWVRTLTSQGGATAAALHELDHYATLEDATRAWEQRVEQLGACSRSTVWLTHMATIDGVADQAVAATLVVQDREPEHHTILVARSGQDVTLLDLTAADQPWALEPAAGSLATLGSRQCAITSATCPTTPTITPRTPPAGEPAGWLTAVDLPRITPGVGTWSGTGQTPPQLSGAGCGAVLPVESPDAPLLHRTYLIPEDQRAAEINFGVDEAVQTLATHDQAVDLASRMGANIDGCAERTKTATVQRTGEVASGGATGPSWVIVHKYDDERTARFRVAVVVSGNRVLYLLSNPVDHFDFTDADWQAIVQRATDRLAQLP